MSFTAQPEMLAAAAGEPFLGATLKASNAAAAVRLGWCPGCRQCRCYLPHNSVHWRRHQTASAKAAIHERL